MLRDKFPYGCQDAESCGPASQDVYHTLPDFWATVLWKRLMGTGVLNATTVLDGGERGPPELRVYAHCTLGRPQAATLLLINVDASAAHTVTLPSIGEIRGGGGGASSYELWRMTPPGNNLTSTQVQLNGESRRHTEKTQEKEEDRRSCICTICQDRLRTARVMRGWCVGTGDLLETKPDGSLPPLVPKMLSGPTLTVAPHTYLFVVVPDVATSCEASGGN